jgi:hypothetical protein
MNLFNVRSENAGRYIPKGPMPQGVFKMAVCNAIGRGVDPGDAVAEAAVLARQSDSDFVPVYDDALLSI